MSNKLINKLLNIDKSKLSNKKDNNAIELINEYLEESPFEENKDTKELFNYLADNDYYYDFGSKQVKNFSSITSPLYNFIYEEIIEEAIESMEINGIDLMESIKKRKLQNTVQNLTNIKKENLIHLIEKSDNFKIGNYFIVVDRSSISSKNFTVKVKVYENRNIKTRFGIHNSMKEIHLINDSRFEGFEYRRNNYFGKEHMVDLIIWLQNLYKYPELS